VSLGGDGDGGGGEGWGEWLRGIPPLALDDTLARSMRLKKRHEVERCALAVPWVRLGRVLRGLDWRTGSVVRAAHEFIHD